MALCLHCAPLGANSCAHRWGFLDLEQAKGSGPGERAPEPPGAGAASGAGPGESDGSDRGRAALVSPRDVAALYQRHRGELVRFLHVQFGAGPPEPEDVVQQAFVNYAGLAAEGEGAEAVRNPRAFLFQTVRNLTISLRRRQSIRLRYAADPAHEIFAAEGDEREPERVYLEKERGALLSAALQSLPERRMKMFVLNQVHGMTQEAIAAEYGVSRSAVHKQLVLALRDVERFIAAAGGADGEG